MESKYFSEYNSIIKEYDSLYKEAIKKLGLNDSSFWILYTLRDEGQGITQRDIVDKNFLPPQTINSELKKLEREGYVELISGKDKRTKQVYLTKNGVELSKRTVEKIMSIEEKTMKFLQEEELEEFLRIFRKYILYLKKNLDNIESEYI